MEFRGKRIGSLPQALRVAREAGVPSDAITMIGNMDDFTIEGRMRAASMALDLALEADRRTAGSVVGRAHAFVRSRRAIGDEERVETDPADDEPDDHDDDEEEEEDDKPAAAPPKKERSKKSKKKTPMPPAIPARRGGHPPSASYLAGRAAARAALIDEHRTAESLVRARSEMAGAGQDYIDDEVRLLLRTSGKHAALRDRGDIASGSPHGLAPPTTEAEHQARLLGYSSASAMHKAHDRGAEIRERMIREGKASR